MHTHSLSICALFQNVVTEMKAHQQKWPRGWYFTFAQRERRSVKQCSLSLKTQQGRIGRISTSGLGSVSFTMSSIPDTAVSCPSWWSPTHLESLQFQWPSAELLGEAWNSHSFQHLPNNTSKGCEQLEDIYTARATEILRELYSGEDDVKHLVAFVALILPEDILHCMIVVSECII